MRNLSASGSLPDCLLDAGSKLQFVHLGRHPWGGGVGGFVRSEAGLGRMPVLDAGSKLQFVHLNLHLWTRDVLC